MTPAQRDLLMKVIDAYAGLMADDIAADRMAKIKAPASTRSRSRGQDRSSADRSTTTASKGRRS